MAGNTIICQLLDPEGNSVGAQLDLPQDASPKDLDTLLNSLLNNDEKLPYAFYVEDKELLTTLREHLLQNNVSVEKLLSIVCHPQAVFRIHPVTRCSATIPGHAEAVLAVAFSPDGRQLASGSGDTTVRFWDINTQTPRFTAAGHRNWVLIVAWSPDGRQLASGGMDGDVRLWDPTTGQSTGPVLKGHKKWVTSLSWQPCHLATAGSGSLLASGSRDGDVRVWDPRTGKTVLCLTGHTLAVTAVKWGGENLIYSGSRDCTIKVWEPGEGKLVRELKGHGHWINSLALSTEYCLRTGPFDPSAKGKNPGFKDHEDMKQAALVRYNAAKGSGERLVSGSDDFTMFLWEPGKSKQPRARLTGHQQLVNHVLFSPDGRWVASASFDKSVRLWDGFSGAYVAVLRGHVGPVYQLSWSADSRLLVSGSKDSTLKVWEVRTKKLREDLPGHADEVFAVDWSPDGSKVASGGKDKMLKLWMN